MKPFFSSANEKNCKVYAAFSGIFSLLGICGLLIGYFTGLAPIGHAIAGGEPILKGSLMGVVIEIMRGSISMPSYNLSYGLSGFLPMTLYILVLVLIGAILLSLAATIAAILLPRFARAVSLFEGILLFFVYTLLFAGNALLFRLSGGKLSPAAFDLPCFLSALLLLCALFFTTFWENKLKSVPNAFLFLMSILVFGAFFLPSAALSDSLNAITLGDESALMRVTLIAFCLMISVNFAVSATRLHAKRGYVFDLVRFGLQLCGMIALIAVSSAENTSLFSDQPLAAIFMLLGSILSIVIPSLCLFTSAKRKVRLRGELSDSTVPVNG